MKLLIVESPHKAKTIKKILDKHFTNKFIVKATKGHILNLPQQELGVFIDKKNNKISIKWIFEQGRKKIVDEIKELAKKADEVFIATDNDREGERIANDIVYKAGIKNYKRVTFLEITEREILNKLFKGRNIDKNIVNAAIARRVVDRIIGYPISNIIKNDFYQKQIPLTPRGVGRVISPSLHILVDLEKKIESFVEEIHKKVLLTYIKDGITFRVSSPISFPADRKKELDEYLFVLNKNPHIVSYYTQKTENINPPKPLVTSTLQYGAWHLFGIKPKEAMKIAQYLFEAGLITYHRTDSVRISKDAAVDMIEYLYKKYGDDYVVSSIKEYKNSNKAQDAHEAIRPTAFNEEFEPENIKLEDNYKKIYEFIWYRTIVTQLKPAIYDVSPLEINVGGNELKTRANHRIFDGWEKFKGELIKTSIKEDDESRDKDVKLPEFNIGEELKVLDISLYDYTPQRPRRYGVGRLITFLSNNGIARPSTLDTIVDNLERKDYIKIIKDIIHPQKLGIKVDEWLETNVNWLIDLELAKTFEEELDKIEEGKADYKDIIYKYYDLVKDLENKLNVSSDVIAPTPAQIALIKKIEDEKGIKANEAVFKNKKLAETFISNYLEELAAGICPICKKGKVLRKDNRFYCNNPKCNFVIFNVEKFFDMFKIKHNEEFVKEFMKALLKHKKVYFPKLINKEGKEFETFVKIKKEGKYYNLTFDFSKPNENDLKTSDRLLSLIGENLENVLLKKRD